MNQAPAPTPYHPRWYHSRVSTYWWLHQWSYLRFVLRELSSVFIAFFVVQMLLEIRAVARGPEAYAAFQHWLRSPLLIVLNVVSLCFILYHAITWLSLAPRAMVIRVRGKQVPDRVVAGTNYLAWMVVSAILGWFLLRG